MMAFPFAAFEPFFDGFAADLANANSAYASHYVNKYHKQQQHQHQRDQQQHQQQSRKHAQAKAAAAAAATAAALPAAAPTPTAPAAKQQQQQQQQQPTAVVVPNCNIFETDAAFVIQVDVPGASNPDVVALANRLKVAAPVAEVAPLGAGARVLRRERARVGRYERAFVLPDGVDADAIEARLDAGVLTIVVPKARPQQPAPKKIKVVVAASSPIGGKLSDAPTPAAATTKAAAAPKLRPADDDDDEGSVEDASEEEMQA